MTDAKIPPEPQSAAQEFLKGSATRSCCVGSQQARIDIFKAQRTRLRALTRKGALDDSVRVDAVIEQVILRRVGARPCPIYEHPFDGRLVSGQSRLPPGALAGIGLSEIRIEVKTFREATGQVDLDLRKFDLLLIAIWRFTGVRLEVDCWYVTARELRARRSVTDRYRLAGELGTRNQVCTNFRVRF